MSASRNVDGVSPHQVNSDAFTALAAGGGFVGQPGLCGGRSSERWSANIDASPRTRLTGQQLWALGSTVWKSKSLDTAAARQRANLRAQPLIIIWPGLVPRSAKMHRAQFGTARQVHGTALHSTARSANLPQPDTPTRSRNSHLPRLEAAAARLKMRMHPPPRIHPSDLHHPLPGLLTNRPSYVTSILTHHQQCRPRITTAVRAAVRIDFASMHTLLPSSKIRALSGRTTATRNDVMGSDACLARPRLATIASVCIIGPASRRSKSHRYWIANGSSRSTHHHSALVCRQRIRTVQLTATHCLLASLLSSHRLPPAGLRPAPAGLRPAPAGLLPATTPAGLRRPASAGLLPAAPAPARLRPAAPEEGRRRWPRSLLRLLCRYACVLLSRGPLSRLHVLSTTTPPCPACPIDPHGRCSSPHFDFRCWPCVQWDPPLLLRLLYILHMPLMLLMIHQPHLCFPFPPHDIVR